MKKPRLIYYNDGHHFHAKRIDPPLNLHKLRWPVDELADTGVDLLAFGLGYGDVYFHNSKVGRVVGQEKDVWEGFIDWRIMRMVKDAKAMGTDQVREVVKRGKEKGMTVFPSLKMQQGNLYRSQRCGWLKWKHGAAVCLGDTEPEPWCYDYTNELVRQDKMAMIREMLVDYEADGMELDFMFGSRYFRQAEIESGIPLMNEYVAQIREMANEIGKQQGREIPLMARVYHRREDNLKVGLDVETWLKNGSIDLVVGQVDAQLLDTGLTEGRWLAEAANCAGASAYIRPPRRVYDDRTIFPTIEMYRALGQTLYCQGFAGMQMAYMPWPLAEEEYHILREVANPDVVARRDKRYLLQPREGQDTGPKATPPPQRQLPARLEEGETTAVSILVSDDIESAKQDGEMREPVLTIRFSEFCVEDEIEIRFNDKVLPIAEAEITDERAMRIQGTFLKPLEAPDSMAAHWFRYMLDVDLLKRGENTLEVEVKKMEKTAGFVRRINGVEIQTRYKDFVRPLGLKVDRIAPIKP